MSSNTTFYSETDDGGMQFSTTRRVGDVRIPNYVYDMWMPLLGVKALGVYATYCRLERHGKTKGLSMKTLARAMRIGTDTLSNINNMLVECGFISVRKPKGWEKLAHFTTEIITHDPPQEIGKSKINKYGLSDYSILTPWLQKDNPQSESSAYLNRDAKETPNRDANIEDTLDVEENNSSSTNDAKLTTDAEEQEWFNSGLNRDGRDEKQSPTKEYLMRRNEDPDAPIPQETLEAASGASAERNRERAGIASNRFVKDHPKLEEALEATAKYHTVHPHSEFIKARRKELISLARKYGIEVYQAAINMMTNHEDRYDWYHDKSELSRRGAWESFYNTKMKKKLIAEIGRIQYESQNEKEDVYMMPNVASAPDDWIDKGEVT